MKRILASIILLTSLGVAQTPESFPITGTLSIKYNTRTQVDGSKPKASVVDTYTLDVNAANSARFKGNITYLPYISNTFGSDQQGRVTYDMDLDVINPKNVAQVRNVGKMFGAVPVDKQNIYHFSEGAGVKIAVLPIGQAKGFESRFSGLALAKPPASSGWSKIKQDAVKLVSSKGGSITLTKYDKMEFQSHVIPAGPVQIYPETAVTGVMFYDYGRSAWHFNNVNFIYGLDGKRMNDTISGSIRWVEDPQRKINGQGQYEFDIRVNEPPPSENAIFSAVADEAAFFASNDNIPALTGTLKYKDSMAGGTVVASQVLVDLKGTSLTKLQVMYLCKLLFLTAVVPLNAE